MAQGWNDGLMSTSDRWAAHESWKFAHREHGGNLFDRRFMRSKERMPGSDRAPT